jgi:hypothetical protein
MTEIIFESFLGVVGQAKSPDVYYLGIKEGSWDRTQYSGIKALTRLLGFATGDAIKILSPRCM